MESEIQVKRKFARQVEKKSLIWWFALMKRQYLESRFGPSADNETTEQDKLSIWLSKRRDIPLAFF